MVSQKKRSPTDRAGGIPKKRSPTTAPQTSIFSRFHLFFHRIREQILTKTSKNHPHNINILSTIWLMQKRPTKKKIGSWFAYVQIELELDTLAILIIEPMLKIPRVSSFNSLLKYVNQISFFFGRAQAYFTGYIYIYISWTSLIQDLPPPPQGGGTPFGSRNPGFWQKYAPNHLRE